MAITGQRLTLSTISSLTPHLITFETGEDAAMRILTFSQQSSRAIWILHADSPISNVTFRNPNTPGGTSTYQGKFEMILLSGSIMPSENAGKMSTSGGMNICLAGPDGKVIGGTITGTLIAAGHVHVIVGSYVPGQQQEHKPEKPIIESVSLPIVPNIVNSVTGEDNLNSLSHQMHQDLKISTPESNYLLVGEEEYKDYGQSKL